MSKNKAHSIVQPVSQNRTLVLPLVSAPVFYKTGKGVECAEENDDCDAVEFLLGLMHKHSDIYMKVYNRMDEIEDDDFINWIKRRYPISDWEWRSIVTFAKAQREAELELDKKRKKDAEKFLEIASEKENGYERRIYEVKAARQLAAVGRRCTFGTRELLSRITKYNNIINENPKKIKQLEDNLEELRNIDMSSFDKKERQKHYKKLNKTFNACSKLKEDLSYARQELPGLKDEYEEKRLRGVQIVGEANQKGNRFFDFNLTDGTVVMKITNTPKILFRFKMPSKKKELEILEKLQKLSDEKCISLTITVTTKHIAITYDVAVLNGYAYDSKSMRIERTKIKKQKLPEKTEKEKIEEIKVKYREEHKERLSKGKVLNRILSIDSNPFFIGWAVVDVNRDEPNNFKIVRSGLIHWYPLFNRWCKAKTPKQHKKVYAQIRNAIFLAMKEVFSYGKHYKCEKFCIEDLSFEEAAEMMSHTSNSKNKNLWMRDLIEELASRRSTENGIRILKINAAYSSFCGGIKHRELPDATAAAVEIGRRGGLCYIKDCFYPSLTQVDLNTLRCIFSEDAVVNDSGTGHTTWVAAYKSCKASCESAADFEHRYRTPL